MLVIIVCICCIALLILVAYLFAKFTKSEMGIRLPIGAAVVPLFILLYSIIAMIVTHMDYCIESKRVKYEERYKALTASIEMNEQNIILLAKEISEYNSEVINGRRAMNDIWLKDISFSFYEDLSLIDLESEEHEK